VSALPPRIILYDGACALCDASVKFCLPRDKAGRLYYCAVQSPLGQRLVAEAGLDPADPASFIFLKDGETLLRSTGALAVGRELCGPWPVLARIGWLVPRPLRDLVYDVIASNRTKWFGARELCLIASPQERQRFLT
jgi:predicted DCC family thiol-disulfide oxidoreductase YuxK